MSFQNIGIYNKRDKKRHRKSGKIKNRNGVLTQEVVINGDGNEYSGASYYKVNQSNDSIIEDIDGGIDTVSSIVSYTLGDNVENIVLEDNYVDTVLGGNNVKIYGQYDRWNFDCAQGNSGLTEYIGGQTYYYHGTCGIVSSQNILIQAGMINNNVITSGSIDLREREVVDYARTNDLCDNSTPNSGSLGGTTSYTISQICAHYGVQLNWQDPSELYSVAEKVKQGYGVIMTLDAYKLWGYTPVNQANHAITIVGAVYDDNNTLKGFYVADSGRGMGVTEYYSYSELYAAAIQNGSNPIAYGYVAYTAEPIKQTSMDINATGNSLDNDITGNEGDNILSGMAGNDTYNLESNWGSDTISDSSGNDRIKFADASVNAGNIEAVVSGNDLIISHTNSSNQITIEDYFVSSNAVETIEFADNSTIEVGSLTANVINGTEGNDTISGTSDKDSIDGGAGNDVIYSGNGEDTLLGGTGNDYLLSGGDEADLLIGGAGNDVYDILGDDTIVENADEGFDVIYTRNTTYAMADNTEYLAATTTEDVNFTGNADDNIVKGNVGNDTISGLAGNDTLVGKAGDDSLIGGTGDDAYDLVADWGNDTISESSGTDKIIFKDESISIDDLTGVQNGNDLVITQNATSNQITIEDYFVSENNEVETLEFADGSSESVRYFTGNKIIGTDGNDSIDGTSAHDSIDGGLGDDYIIDLLGGHNTLIGGSGNDTIVVGAEVDTNATIYAGEGDDAITAHSNVGVDYIDGGLGNDTYCVDSTDVIVDAGGHDLIYVFQEQSFTIENYDFIEDLHSIYTGDVSLTGNNVANSICANTGFFNDTLFGLAGDDTLVGDQGNDYLNGGAGNDVYEFDLDDGNDTIVDSSGSDTIVINTDFFEATVYAHQSGDDLIVSNDFNSSYLTIENYFVSDSNKIETVEFANDTISDFVEVSDLIVNLVDGTSGDDTISGSSYKNSIDAGVGNDTIYGGNREDTIMGGAGNDYIISGGDEADYLVGGVGNDVYDVVGDDTIVENAGEGFDVIYTRNTTYTMADNTEYLAATTTSDVNFTGNADSTYIKGNVGNDTISGLGGNDTLYGKAGNDSLDGGSGDDTYVVETNAGNDTISESLGADKIKFNDESITLDDLTGIQSGNDLIITDTISSNQITIQDYFVSENNEVEILEFADGSTESVRYFTANKVAGTSASDSINGISLHDSIDGGDGNDSIYGGNGEDTIMGGDGNDYIVGGGDEADLLVGGTGNDVYDVVGSDVVIENAGEGFDVVYTRNTTFTMIDNTEYLAATTSEDVNFTGNADATIIKGNVGNDIITGLGGNDTLYGKAGNDVLDGGIGNDTYVIESNAGNDTIVDSSGVDKIKFTDAAISFDDLTGVQNGNDLVITDTISSAQVTIQDYFISENNEIEILEFSDSSIEYIDSFFSNTITGTSSADTLSGANTKDSIDGGAGNDVIWGGNGEDTLIGGDGNDYLVGGGDEIDSLVGGTGNDVYDVLGNDIVIENVGEGFDVVYTRNTTFTMIDNTEYLAATTSEDVDFTGNADGTIIKGNSGNDTINGLGGNDTLYGKAGNDTFEFASGDGQDIVIDSSGTDEVQFTDASITSNDVAIYMDGSNNLIINYGAGDQVTIQDQVSNTIERVELNDGLYMTDSDINQLIQDMNQYATDNSLSISNVDDVANNSELMTMIANTWHN